MQSILQKQRLSEIKKFYLSKRQWRKSKEQWSRNKKLKEFKRLLPGRATKKPLHRYAIQIKRLYKQKVLILAGLLRSTTGDLPLLVAAVSLLFLFFMLPGNVYTMYFLAIHPAKRAPTIDTTPHEVYHGEHSDHVSIAQTVSLVENSYHLAHEEVGQLQDSIYTGRGGSADTASRLFIPLETNVYTVETGDTLSEIATAAGLRVDTLISYNNVQNARRLQRGENLLIPDRDGIMHIVASGETLEEIAAQYTVERVGILDANNLRTADLNVGQVLFVPGAEMGSKELRLALGELFRMPTYGSFSSHFGYRADPFTGLRRFHYGLDIANAMNTPITAASSGHVVFVGNNPLSYGRYVIIKHDSEFQTLYGHLEKVLVSNGEYVSSGETIGTMGNTGRSTGPHLHFSIIRRSSFVNPSDYLF